MKIKTIAKKINTVGVKEFDREVNDALAEGWILGKRGTLPGIDLGSCFFSPSLYAELAMLDPAPEVDEPAPLDPLKAMDAIEALYVVREFCDSNKCEGCQLFDFCARHLPNNEGPADWKLPGEEAPEV